jgi:type IX secretion system PorP/SprF family membrane protein
MKKILLSGILAALTLISVAQQDPQYTQWQFDRLSVNPAFSGIDRNHSIFALHRDQWDGLDRDPKTYLFNYSGMYGAKQNFGVGATFITEVLGQQQNTVFRVSPSYHLELSNNNYFSGGVSLGFVGTTLGDRWVFIDQGDASIPTNEINDGSVDVGLGIAFYQPRKYYIGLSSTHLGAPSLDDVQIQVARHYYVMGGYEAAVSSNISIRPNVMLKTDAASTQFDVNADVIWNQMLWGGLAFRPGDAISPYVGFQKDLLGVNKGQSQYNHGIRMGYSYDVTTSELSDFSAGSHELFLCYYWKVTEMPIRARHSNPRFL